MGVSGKARLWGCAALRARILRKQGKRARLGMTLHFFRHVERSEAKSKHPGATHRIRIGLRRAKAA